MALADANAPHFRIFGFPVRVRASFLVLSVILGIGDGKPIGLAIWMVVVFVGILLHELGHALMGKAFGLSPAIELGGMGGLTYWAKGRNVGAGKSLLISLAGPAVGITIGVAAKFIPAMPNPILHDLVRDIVWVNLYWGVFNLFPILPLDGGNALRSLVQMTKLFDAELVVRIVSLVALAGLGLLLLAAGGGRSIWNLILLANFVMINVGGLRTHLSTRGDVKTERGLQDAYPQWLATRDGRGMIRAGTEARRVARTPHLAAYATEVIAMGQCLEGDPQSALATLNAMPPGFAPSVDVALHVLMQAGELAAAEDYLERQAKENDDPSLRAKLDEVRRIRAASERAPVGNA